MKNSKRFILFFLASVLCFTACQNSDGKKGGMKDITTFHGSLDSVAGPKEEVSLINNFPKALYRIYTIDGLGSFYVDSRIDIIKNQLRSGQIWENEIVDLLKKHVKPGSTAIDIGSHVGTHTLSMSKLIGKDGQVVAFEPQIKLYSELVMNMALNGCRNVTAYRCALGDISKDIEMSPSVADNEGGTGIGQGGDCAKMITLDSLNLDNVSFIKIDVENFEYEVLKGAEQTIRKSHPVMIIEIMGNTYNPIPNRAELVHRVLHQVEQMGYTLKYIEGSWSDWLAIPVRP